MEAIPFLLPIDLNKYELRQAVVQNLSVAPTSPEAGQLYFDTNGGTNKLKIYDGTAWVFLGGDLGWNASTSTVTNSAGTNATLTLVDSTNPGLMSSADFDKLGSIVVADIQANVQADWNETDTGDDSFILNKPTDVTDLSSHSVEELSDVTSSGSGSIITTAERTKLTGIATGAEVNVNADWDSTSGDSQILNRPDIITDAALAGATDDNLGSTLAIKTYVDNQHAGGLSFMGGYDVANNSPSLDTSPYTTINKGDTYVCTSAGNFFTEAMEVGDTIIAEVDSPTTLAQWTRVNKNIPAIVDASTTEKGIIEIATQTEVNAGTDTVRAVVPSTLSTYVAAQVASRKSTTTIGDGSATVYTINTGGTARGLVEVTRVSDGAVVYPGVEWATDTQVQVTFGSAPATGAYKVTISI